MNSNFITLYTTLPKEKFIQACELSVHIQNLQELRSKVKSKEDDISSLKWISIHESDWDLVKGMHLEDYKKVEIKPELIVIGDIREAYKEYKTIGKYTSNKCVILRNLLLHFQRRATFLQEKGIRLSENCLSESILSIYIKRRQMEIECVQLVENFDGEKPNNCMEYLNNEIELALKDLAALYAKPDHVSEV